ncbi:MAG: sulfotransferase [Ardenticatenaceae bacterium]|nr:sulfotransferase [Ardenticatenaceae bacterium]MCB9005495.1 sulfotransferase [Ardenticatenaceae bacterium]
MASVKSDEMLEQSQLIYIAGASHSGSTLLDLLLGNHSAISGMGEIHRLSLQPETRLCSCGETINNCPYWNKIAHLTAIEFGLPIIKWEEFCVTHIVGTKYLRKFPTALDLGLIAGQMSLLKIGSFLSSDIKKYINMAANSWLLFDVIAKVQKASYVVDSTKSAGRMKVLYLTRPKNTRIIYLVRDGRAVTASAIRRGQQMSQAAKLWQRVNKNLLLMMRTIPQESILTVFYENICRNPEREMRKISAFLNAPYESIMTKLNISKTHNIPGNPMLFEREQEIQIDERWKSQLTSFELKIFDDIAGNLNRHFGYEN